MSRINKYKNKKTGEIEEFFIIDDQLYKRFEERHDTRLIDYAPIGFGFDWEEGRLMTDIELKLKKQRVIEEFKKNYTKLNNKESDE